MPDSRNIRKQKRWHSFSTVEGRLTIFVISYVILLVISVLYASLFMIGRRTGMDQCFDRMGWGVSLFAGLMLALVCGIVYVFSLQVVLGMFVSCNVCYGLGFNPAEAPSWAMSVEGCGASGGMATSGEPLLHFLGSSDPYRSSDEGNYNAVLLVFVTVYVFTYMIRLLASADYLSAPTTNAPRKPWEKGYPRSAPEQPASSEASTGSLLSSPPPSPPPSPSPNGKSPLQGQQSFQHRQLMGGVELGVASVKQDEFVVLEDAVPNMQSTDAGDLAEDSKSALPRPSHRRRPDCLCCSAAQLCHLLGFQDFSDLFYRHFDVLVGVIITTLLLILALLPMKVLRMALVYNQGFASTVLRVAQRRRHFLNELLQR